MASGDDLHAGYRYVDDREATYDVQGVLLPRPFKITRIGPVTHRELPAPAQCTRENVAVGVVDLCANVTVPTLSKTRARAEGEKQTDRKGA